MRYGHEAVGGTRGHTLARHVMAQATCSLIVRRLAIYAAVVATAFVSSPTAIRKGVTRVVALDDPVGSSTHTKESYQFDERYDGQSPLLCALLPGYIRTINSVEGAAVRRIKGLNGPMTNRSPYSYGSRNGKRNSNAAIRWLSQVCGRCARTSSSRARRRKRRYARNIRSAKTRAHPAY